MKPKPLPFQIRAFDMVRGLLERAGVVGTPEGRHAIKCLQGPADRARRRMDKKAVRALDPLAPDRDEWTKQRDKADAAFSQYIRFRDTKGGATLSERSGYCNTCRQMKTGNDLQCCHWLSRKFFGTRWHEFNCAAGCWGCNSKMMGNGRPNEFEAYIVLVHGAEWPDKLRIKAKINAKKPTITELEKITDEFERKLSKLKEREGLDG